MASPDHAAILRAFLDNCVPGLTTPDVADAQDALDTLVAALAQARQERDELSWKLNKDSQWFELLATRERAERAERERDQAVQALREALGNIGHKAFCNCIVCKPARFALAAIDKERTDA